MLRVLQAGTGGRSGGVARMFAVGWRKEKVPLDSARDTAGAARIEGMPEGSRGCVSGAFPARIRISCPRRDGVAGPRQVEASAARFASSRSCCTHFVIIPRISAPRIGANSFAGSVSAVPRIVAVTFVPDPARSNRNVES